MKSKIQNNGHANLDSFPFRYGFTYSETTYIELINMRNKSTIVDNRYHIDADFINPSTNKEETGHFVIVDDNSNTVVTVWRIGRDNRDETRLSETLRSARVRGKITTNDMIKMHGLKISTLDEFIDYLTKKISTKEIEEIIADATKKIDKLSHALKALNGEKQVLQSDIRQQKEKITELSKENQDLQSDKEKQDIETKELLKIIEQLESVTAAAYDGRSNGGTWNPGIYTVSGVRWGNKGRNNQRAVLIKLKDENNFEFEAANNWASGLDDRYKQAELLIGHKVKYSTWGSFSRDWFMNISKDIE
jgi:arsenate reductase-like glutaredoxin family protein